MRGTDLPGGISRARLTELYLPTTKDFVFVDVPEMQFAVIEGAGSPDRAPFKEAVKWLFSAIYPLKRIAKERMGKDFVEPPLEALWWADDIADLIAARTAELKWRLMIVTADWVDDPMFERAAATASKKLGKVPRGLRLDRFAEGKCVQIMHVGDYRSEASAIAARLHNEFLPKHDLRPNGHHHEIYLSDPSRVAPERMRTVLRQPVR